MRILVTGGAGYIGSHTVVLLQEAGHQVTIADNLSNAEPAVLERIAAITGVKPDFHLLDVTDEAAARPLFQEGGFQGLIHFAGYKAVGESVQDPLKYYENNLRGTITMARLAVEHQVGSFIFSSSATVYGENESPMVEDMPCLPTTNPYGETKAMSERILRDAAAAHPGFNVTLLRYFNPVGAHPSGLIGENPKGIPNNLLPYITQVASGKREALSIFGRDYDTTDGTGVRDYIHVMDLAAGHLAALLGQKPGVSLYNLGTGAGTSVLELLHAFQEENHITIPHIFAPRRPGDIAVSYAHPGKAKAELGWEARLTIRDMVRDAWNFQKNLKD